MRALLHSLFHKNSTIRINGWWYCYGCNDYLKGSKR